ncbi:MAG TPA: LON peptidase substrate-binding domain-containing protein [Flavihumibacter sp.]|nr:LON peptidase substrate-binding domain-containing protein [Bacteroidota bacterium]HOA36756.1 LON peptidase substrate-binding domain-containing protein [Flavihumibacter sp.]HPZ86790.1 LON peptidase substrate-binding domain-containing protein [Flavihumibacter sp.]HQD08318.1 LON peptidase substrate-binding domain-containing protein [Flavihumibacter sp.]
MTNFIPIFPLGIVVYPGEDLNLHIFEPRYKQLIKECAAAKKPFGIPTVINQRLGELGTLVSVVEITKEYENGEMDIKTKGGDIFRILETVKEIPDKLYSGAIVTYPENARGMGIRELMNWVVNNIREMHKMLDVHKDFKLADDQLLSYDVAHHAGMTIEEEYELLGLLREDQRQEYLKRHLTKMLPVLKTVEELKQKVKLNGHFKNLSSLDLDI